MKRFWEENFILIIGILLPILVLIMFWLAAIIPKYLVQPPQYNLIFGSGYNEFSNARLKTYVENGKIKIIYVCKNLFNFDLGSINRPKLYMFDAKTQKIKQIEFSLPPIPPQGKSLETEIKIPELEHLTLDTSLRAPDGYKFSENDLETGLLFSQILFGFDHKHHAAISKNGYQIVIQPEPRNGYDFYKIQFIGWVIH